MTNISIGIYFYNPLSTVLQEASFDLPLVTVVTSYTVSVTDEGFKFQNPLKLADRFLIKYNDISFNEEMSHTTLVVFSPSGVDNTSYALTFDRARRARYFVRKRVTKQMIIINNKLA